MKGRLACSVAEAALKLSAARAAAALARLAAAAPDLPYQVHVSCSALHALWVSAPCQLSCKATVIDVVCIFSVEAAVHALAPAVCGGAGDRVTARSGG